jgi:hypothetical protein
MVTRIRCPFPSRVVGILEIIGGKRDILSGLKKNVILLIGSKYGQGYDLLQI